MHFLLILPQISEICYLRNLFNEDCFIPKNYAGVMINALHPMDREEKNIHNEEAWQLTRWLEEGVFGTIPCLSSRSMPSKSAIFGVWFSPSTTIPNTRTNPNCSKPTPVPSPPFSHPDAFTYPDPVNVTLEMTRNNVDKSTLSTDGVKNQAVSPLLSSHTGDVATHSHHTLQHAESAATGAMDHHAALPPDYQPTFFEDSAQALVRPGDSPFVSSPFVMEAGRLRTVRHRRVPHESPSTRCG